MNEDQLMQAAQQLGARAAERLDVDATAQKVIERLREQPQPRTVWVRATWLRIAAALVIVFGGAYAVRARWQGAAPADQVTNFIADDLQDLSAEDLRTLLASFDQIFADSVGTDSTSDLQELDAQQLRKLLQEG
jgi:hypothetical protein